MSVTVVGSLNEDVLIPVARLPGRGETVIGGTPTRAGRQGRQPGRCRRPLGPGVHMVGRVGDDPAGARKQAALAECRVNVSRVHRTAGVPTGTATIPVEAGSGENLIVVVPGANAALTPEDVDVAPVHRADVLLLQLEVPMETVTAAAAGGRRHRGAQPRAAGAAARGAAGAGRRPRAQRARAGRAGRRPRHRAVARGGGRRSPEAWSARGRRSW